MKGYDRFRLDRDGTDLAGYIQPGDGPIVVLQHGLCADANQPAELIPPQKGYRHAVLDCRGHGKSAAGPDDQLSLATFTDDVAAMVAALDQAPAAVGGISMGAAIALRLAVFRPDLVHALILVRPAWVVDSAPANMGPNAVVGGMLAAGYGLADFDQGTLAQTLAAQAPDNLASLRGFFDRKPLPMTAALLRRISADGPGVTINDLSVLTMPVLIIGCTDDIIHPISHAQTLEVLIPGSRLVKVPSKGQNRADHIAGVQGAIANFMEGLL